jgi:hypothetical protein
MTRRFWSRRAAQREALPNDRGAILVLALLFIVAVGLIVTALTTWATNDLSNTKTFTNVQELHSDATGMMKLSVGYVRYNPIIQGNQATNVASPVTACWGGTDPTKVPSIDGYQVAVWCSTVWNPSSANTRVVTFYACESIVPASICTSSGGALLTEVVTFDDYPSGINAPNQTLCSLLCGEGETVVSSNWGSPTVNTVAYVPASATFVEEPSPTIVNNTTTAEVQILTSGGLPISGDQVTISASSGGSLSTASTLTQTTNTSGIAYFSNIVPASAGTLILGASDGTVNTTSTGFAVGQGVNAITLSAVPSNAQSQTSVSVTSSATSGDNITVTGTNLICTPTTVNNVSTVVLGPNLGTCTLTFVDAGNSNYVAASNTMQFPVVAPGPTKIALSTGSPSPTASGVTNDSLTVALQTSSGAAAVSSGTTTVALSQTGNGYFASTNGSTSNTTTATFANGVGTVTVYFGDTVAESDTVTASSAGLTSANTTLHTVAAAASKVAMTATTSVVASATTNDAVTLAIQDQYGNPVTPTGSTTLNLTSTAPGFFTAANGVSNTAAITTVTLAAGTGQKIVYFGDQTAQTATLTSTGPGLSGSTFVTVTPGSASKVGVTPSATTAAASSSSNDPVVISLQDQFGNTVTPTVATAVTLTSTTPGFFTASNGTQGSTGSITMATINANASSKTVYFGDQTAQTATLTMSSAGLTSGTAQIKVSSAGPSQLGVTAQSSTLTATSVGTDAVTLTLEDVNGNTVTATAAVPITLQDSGGGFYTATKNSGTQISTASIPIGSSSVTVYFGDTNAETTTLQAGGTYSGTSSVTVNAGSPTQVVLIPTTTNPGRSNRASDSITIQAEDQFGNPTATAPSSSYTLTTSTGNGFFSTTYDSYGGSSSVAINLNGANNGQSSIYFGDNTNKDNPSIQLYDANNRLVASVAVTA